MREPTRRPTVWTQFEGVKGSWRRVGGGWAQQLEGTGPLH